MKLFAFARLTAAGLASLSLAAVSYASDVIQVDVLEDTPGHAIVRFSLLDYTSETVTINGGDYTSLWLEGEGYLYETGSPQLPHVCRSLAIADTGRMDVQMVSGSYHDIRGVDVTPSRGVIYRNQDPETVPYTFGPTYGQDAWYPAEPATHRDPYIMREVRGMVLEANMFQYNPVTKTLRVYDEMVLEVNRVEGTGVNPIDRGSQPDRSDAGWDLIYRRHFINPDPVSRDDRAGFGDMLIISHGPFMAAMQPFINWKNSVGIATTIVDVATIGNNATSIGNYIDSVYAQGNLAYVLLVGDKPQIATPSYAGGESDPTYSLQTGDEYPDLLIGRFSAENTGHVDTQVQRTIEYEQQYHATSLGGWHAKAIGIGSNQGPGHYGEDDDEHLDLIRDDLLNAGFTVVDRVYDYFGTKSMITNGLNEGRRVIHYCGHGSTTSWGSTGFSNSDVNNLTNVGKLVFIHSVACVNGNFSSTCFGEAWLRATHNGEPTGAVGAYMSSINQSWNPPMYGQATHGKSTKPGTAELFMQGDPWSIGGIWFGGSATMIDLQGGAGVEMFRTWHCFGDPSCRINGSYIPPTLSADQSEISISRPVLVNLFVEPGGDYAGETYLLFAGASGTDPGFTLPNLEVLPLNWDALTTMGLAQVNGPVFQNFFGTLDGTGYAQAQFDTTTVVPIGISHVGSQIHFAGIVWKNGDPYDFQTDAVTLTIGL